MRRLFFSALTILLLCSSLQFLSGQQATAPAPGEKKRFSYDQVFGGFMPGRGGRGDGILGRLPEVTGWADEENYLEVRVDPADKQRKVFAVNAVNGSARIYRDYSEIQKNLPAGFNAQSAAATTPDLSRFIFNRDNDLYSMITRHSASAA